MKFAYATNGCSIIEYDYFTGQERELDTFPTPVELWRRLRAGQGLDDDTVAERLLTPSYIGDKVPRYYQEIAINRAMQAILQGQKRILTYSLSQGIEDGFLAPYRVHRILTNFDAAGWRPVAGELDRYGRYSHHRG